MSLVGVLRGYFRHLSPHRLKDTHVLRTSQLPPRDMDSHHHLQILLGGLRELSAEDGDEVIRIHPTTPALERPRLTYHCHYYLSTLKDNLI